MKNLWKTLTRTPLVALLALPVHALAPAQDEPAAEDSGGEEGAGEEEEPEKTERWFAITNGDIHTGTGAILRNGTILSRNGVITGIGYDLYLPEGTDVLDAMGMHVYPGLVALAATNSITQSRSSFQAELEDDHELDAHFGLDSAVDEGLRALYGDPEEGGGSHVDTGEEDSFDLDQYAALEGLAAKEVRNKLEDGFDPFSQTLVLALATGITTADQSGAAMKLKRGEIDRTMMREKSQATFAWGTSSPTGTQSTREKFAIAAKYKRLWDAWNALPEKQKKEKKEPKKPRGFDASALSVLNGELLARFNADDREDLQGIAVFAQEYGFRPVIWGCREGWTVAAELGRAGAYAVVTPRDRNPKDERLLRDGGTSIENAATLHAHGVQVAIRPASTGFSMMGITGRDLMHLPVEAAFGVRGGLSNEAALASITLVPARILGVDRRVGTLEVGKDMDAIVTDGDVLHYQTFVQWAVVHGKQVYDKEKEIYFAHIRPRPKPPEAEAPDAKEEEQEAPEERPRPAEDEAI